MIVFYCIDNSNQLYHSLDSCNDKNWNKAKDIRKHELGENHCSENLEGSFCLNNGDSLSESSDVLGDSEEGITIEGNPGDQSDSPGI